MEVGRTSASARVLCLPSIHVLVFPKCENPGSQESGSCSGSCPGSHMEVVWKSGIWKLEGNQESGSQKGSQEYGSQEGSQESGSQEVRNLEVRKEVRKEVRNLEVEVF